MLKINTDFKALRHEGGEAAVKPTLAETPKVSVPVKTDAATLTEQHRAIIQANLDASKSRIQSLDDARTVSHSLRQAIAQHKDAAFASHEGITSNRVQSLLQ